MNSFSKLVNIQLKNAKKSLRSRLVAIKPETAYPVSMAEDLRIFLSLRRKAGYPWH